MGADQFEREDVEAVADCLGDDAAQLRQENDEDERADNMDRAASMLTWMLLTHPAYAAGVPDQFDGRNGNGYQPLPPDDDCDKAAAQAMDRVAAKHNMHALDLNPNVMEHHTLRRELVRAGYALAAGVRAGQEGQQ